MKDKIALYHFYNGNIGGVQSVIHNLLRYSSNKKFENHIIYTVNKDIHSNRTFPKIEGSVSEQVFLFSAHWNFYYTCRELAKLLPDEKAVVVAHDWLELGMMSNLGLQNRVVLFVHGAYEYYYQLAVKHEKAIDLFIPVAQNIKKNLLERLPQRTADINYLRFPVPDLETTVHERENNIVFIGRLSSAKGYPIVAEIANRLKEENIHWHIIGKEDPGSLTPEWDENIRVIFYGNRTNSEVLELLPQMKVILLPSLAEGMPVVLIEAMKAGVIPIVNDLPGGIQELIIDGQTGYKIPGNHVTGYIERIMELMNSDRDMLTLQKESMELANNLFNPLENTKKIEDRIIGMLEKNPKSKMPEKVYGSRLDNKYFPNFMTTFFRSNKKKTIE